MKNTSKITMALAIVGMVTITAWVIRRMNTKRMLSQVADEGYETAPDILFPGKNVSRKLHYGPILPL